MILPFQSNQVCLTNQPDVLLCFFKTVMVELKLNLMFSVPSRFQLIFYLVLSCVSFIIVLAHPRVEKLTERTSRKPARSQPSPVHVSLMRHNSSVDLGKFQ